MWRKRVYLPPYAHTSPAACARAVIRPALQLWNPTDYVAASTRAIHSEKGRADTRAELGKDGRLPPPVSAPWAPSKRPQRPRGKVILPIIYGILGDHAMGGVRANYVVAMVARRSFAPPGKRRGGAGSASPTG